MLIRKLSTERRRKFKISILSIHITLCKKSGKSANIWSILNIAEPITNINVKVTLAVVTVLIISLFLPSYKSIDTNFEVGTIWSNEDLIATFLHFQYIKMTKY